MAQLIVRNLDDAVKERLRERARRNGRSLEAEARAVLEAASASEQPPPDSEGLGSRAKKLIGKSALSPDEWGDFEEALANARKGWTVRDLDFSE